VRLKIEAEYASGDEAETSVIIMNTEYLRCAKQVQISTDTSFQYRELNARVQYY
jgi:hypothetical protein